MKCSFTMDGCFVCPEGQLPPHEVEQATTQFQAFDIDNAGSVSFANFATAMIRHDKTFGHPSRRQQLESMYRAADVDGNGRVDLIDFLVMRVRNNRAARSEVASDASVRVDIDQASEAMQQQLRFLDLSLITQAAREDRGQPTAGSGSGSDQALSARSYVTALSSCSSNYLSDSSGGGPLSPGSLRPSGAAARAVDIDGSAEAAECSSPPARSSFFELGRRRDPRSPS